MAWGAATIAGLVCLGDDRRSGCPTRGDVHRVPTTDTKRLAVLIDSDKTGASLTTELLAEIARHGTPTSKRASGAWTRQHLVGWKEELLDWRGRAGPTSRQALIGQAPAERDFGLALCKKGNSL